MTLTAEGKKNSLFITNNFTAFNERKKGTKNDNPVLITGDLFP